MSIAAAVSHANYGLRVELIGGAQTRSEIAPLVIDVTVQSKSTFAGYSNFSLNDVGEAAVIFAVHVLREIHFPTQSVIHSQFRSDAPGVLTVIEHSVLALGGVDTRAHIATQLGNIAKQERRQIKASISTASGSRHC